MNNFTYNFMKKNFHNTRINRQFCMYILLMDKLFPQHTITMNDSIFNTLKLPISLYLIIYKKIHFSIKFFKLDH